MNANTNSKVITILINLLIEKWNKNIQLVERNKQLEIENAKLDEEIKALKAKAVRVRTNWDELDRKYQKLIRALEKVFGCNDVIDIWSEIGVEMTDEIWKALGFEQYREDWLESDNISVKMA